jgi:hypothetical protein
MAASSDIVKLHLGSTELSDPDIQTFIEKAEALYDAKRSGEQVTEAVYDDVVEYLAAHLIASGPERQISSAGEGGGNVSFEGNPNKTTHWENAIEADPTGQLDDGNDHFTLST